MTRGIGRFLLLGGLLVCICQPAAAADISFVPERSIHERLPDSAHVQISGEITDGDPVRLRVALALLAMARSSNPMVVLDSPGGNVPAALEMGRILRESLAHTIVDRDGSCSSSCVFLLAGGVMRDLFLNGKIGLHRPRFDYEPYGGLSKDQAKAAYDALIGRCVDYMKEMGISEKVFSDMLRVPSQSIRFVDRDYANEQGLVGTDPGWEEWSRAKAIKSKGEARVKAGDRRLDCYNKGELQWVCEARYKKDLDAIK